MAESKGGCIWFTGRSGAGKSTIARALISLLDESQRKVTELDVVPCLEKTWFERTSRGKLLRKGFVAKEVARHGGLSVCVTISARREVRQRVRELLGASNFVEVFVDTPEGVCRARKAARKRKPRLTKRAKAAVRTVLAHIPFRRRSSYEPPTCPDVVVNGAAGSPEASADVIFRYLVDNAFVHVRKAGEEVFAVKPEHASLKQEQSGVGAARG